MAIPPSPLIVATVLTVASAVLTGVVRRLAIARAVLDVPNERSLHQVPIPRGGGLALALLLIGVVAWAGWQGWLPGGVAVGLLGGATVVAVVGWVDDVRSLSSGVRAAAQIVAAIWFLAWTGGLPALRLGDTTVTLGVVGSVLALLGVVWSINFYNFMDGIDGIAGGQAVVAGSVAALLLGGPAPALSIVCAALAGASLGFLVWNWAPARIFMGDAGSGLLGFLFAALGLLSERSDGPPLLSWAMFGGVFIFDATVTLLRRVAHGERWYAAHRSHAYQRAVQSGWSHARVTTGVMLMSGVLGLLGALVARRPELLLPVGGAALGLLSACYLWVERRMPMWRPSGAV